MRYTPFILALAATAGSLLAVAPAEARQRYHVTRVHGPDGHFYRSRSVSRDPGHVSVRRQLQTPGGRGHDSRRSASWGDGHYHGSASHVLNDGRVYARSTSLHDNGDGTVSYSRARSGPNYDVSRSGTFNRRD